MTVPFRDIPPVLRNAVVAVEDEGFWKHMGLNPWRIPGAAIANIRSGRKGQGFSTLTMQISRLLFLTPEKTYRRKIQEVILAFQIEKTFTKEEIFTLYCNQVYFGHGNYGVEAASQFFFSKPARDSDPRAGGPAGRSRPGSGTTLPHRLSRPRPRAAKPRPRAHARGEVHPGGRGPQGPGGPLGLDVRRERPSEAPVLRRGGAQVPRARLRQPAHLPGWPARPHDARPGPATRRHAGAHGRPALARPPDPGFRPPRGESILDADGSLPARLHLPEWDRPLARGRRRARRRRRRRIARTPTSASATTTAHLTLADIAWTRKTSVADALPLGAVAPFTILGLSESGGRKEARVALEQEPKVEGALLALDVRSGAVRAMVGGYDFERSKFNRATQAMRQVGSAFKPIVYAAALEKLQWTPATVIVDSPLSFPNPWSKTVWAPQNYDRTYLGPDSAAQGGRAEPQRPRRQDAPGRRVSRRASSTPASSASPASCPRSSPSPSAPARRRCRR